MLGIYLRVERQGLCLLLGSWKASLLPAVTQQPGLATLSLMCLPAWLCSVFWLVPLEFKTAPCVMTSSPSVQVGEAGQSRCSREKIKRGGGSGKALEFLSEIMSS